MIDANLPAWLRGLGLRLATLAAATGLMLAAIPPADARQQDEPAPTQAEPDETKTTPEEADRQEVLQDSVYVDPRATAAMQGNFPELYTGIILPRNSDRLIAQMARGSARLDPAMIDRFIKGAARQLTDHSNIEAISRPDGQYSRIQEIETGGRYLMLPYTDVPADQRDRRFLQVYNTKLLEIAPELLSNHLYARVQVMQALSRMEDPQALRILVPLLADDTQPLLVKQLAAEGIKRIALATGIELSPTDREQAATALVGFLRSNPDAYWMAQARALQALGALRQVSGIQNRERAIFADETMAALASDDLRIESRAWAGWSLGMYIIPPNYPQLNYSLAAYELGRLAEEIAGRIVELSDPREAASYNPERVKYLTGLLVEPIFEAFDGSSKLPPRQSGMRNLQALGPHRQYVERVHQLIRQLAGASVELTRAVGSQRPAARDAVIARLNELRGFLNENRPQENTFVPGGRQFALSDAS
ncbi:hypothetical protein [Tautonia sociabilis]|uniref:HEAT repeat domain-containing protein n=1 Tax=Tautonia sociabilis TaxID=2080755 RepID=A0A432MQ10_9BACT|nr:hypothetical protein [Tautonia sociabilis]RUL89554.1 hypothetical protein TsocGM_01930 [Tautonia sociabilis]